MNTRQDEHPQPSQLRAFAQGLLQGDDFAQIEEHVAQCDRCCQQLADSPDSTLVALARDAATRGFRDRPAAQRATDGIPRELESHPRYHVLERIGAGGMGAVYKAEHRMMHRDVALKVVHPRLLSNPQAVERFQREVQLAARLSHPNIVASHDADQAGELNFLVMEYVDGVSLDERIAASGPATPRQACEWIRQAALGLQHAHQQGMAHRDIKPHNLMITADDQVKILDFGLTRLTTDASSLNDAAETAARGGTTGEGVILGTPDYIAPEQINDSRTADIRADIYSLGCTLYYALTGRAPFPDGALVEKLHAHATRPLPRLDEIRDDVPPRLIEILDRMTAKDLSQRYATPGEVADDLAQLNQLSSIRPSLRKKPVRPFPWGAASVAGAVLAGLLAIVLAWSLFGGGGGEPPRDDDQPLAGDAVPPVAPDSATMKLLLMLPSQGLWYEDYERVVDAVREQREKNGVKVELVAAGVSSQPSSLAAGSFPGEARRDVDIDRQLRAYDYDAIIFIGYDTRDFTPGGDAGESTLRILQEFDREEKVIASLCAGQRALALNGLLRGKRVAACQYVDESEITAAGGTLAGDDVVQDGLVITASRESYAGRLVEKILETIQR